MTRPKLEPDRRFASKLTPEVAARVRADRAAGKKSLGEIARELGVHRSSVSAIVAGRTHKPGPTEPSA